MKVSENNGKDAGIDDEHVHTHLRKNQVVHVNLSGNTYKRRMHRVLFYYFFSLKIFITCETNSSSETPRRSSGSSVLISSSTLL